MVRARARTRRGSAGAVLRSQPARQNPHDLEREIGSFVDEVEELFLADRREIDVGHGNRGRAARGFVDQRHFAEQIVFAELIEQALTRSDVDPTLPVQYSRTLRTSIDLSLRDRRVFAWVLSILGWLAVVLAAVGLYGLLAQSVAERTREFGIRMAIGGGQRHIFVLVITQALWIGVLGTALGIGLAFVGSRLVEAQLYGVTRLDPVVYVMAAASLGVVVLLAGLWPARTATRIEPVEALRIE